MPTAYHGAEAVAAYRPPARTHDHRSLFPVIPGPVSERCRGSSRILADTRPIPSINIGNALTLGLTAELKLKSDQVNIALALFFVPYVLFEIPSNLLLKRFKPHVWRKYRHPRQAGGRVAAACSPL